MSIFTPPNIQVFVIAAIALVITLAILLYNKKSETFSAGVSLLVGLFIIVVGHLQNSEMAGNLVAVVLFISLISYLVYLKKIPQAKAIVLAVVLEAEKKFGSDTGEIKYCYVSGLVYPKLPSIVRFFVTEKQLDIWVEDSVLFLKNCLQSDEKTEDTKKLE